MDKSHEIIEEQLNTIKALNWCIGGKDSTTTENLIRASRLLKDDECFLYSYSELNKARIERALETIEAQRRILLDLRTEIAKIKAENELLKRFGHATAQSVS